MNDETKYIIATLAVQLCKTLRLPPYGIQFLIIYDVLLIVYKLAGDSNARQ